MTSVRLLHWVPGELDSDPAQSAKCVKCEGQVLTVHRFRNGDIETKVECMDCGEEYGIVPE